MGNDLAQADNASPTADGNPTPEPAAPVAEAPQAASIQAPASEQSTIPTPSAEPVLVDGGMEGYDKMLADVHGGRNPFASSTSATAVAAAQPEPGEPAEVAPEPEAATAATATAPQGAEVEAAAEPEGEAEDVKIPERIRLGGLSDKSKAQVAAATMLAKAEGIEFDEAYARVKGEPAPAAPVAAQPVPQPALNVRSDEAIKAEITTLETEEQTAADEMDTGKMLKAGRQIRALQDEMASAQRARADHAANFQRDMQTANARAIELYPDLADENSDFYKGVQKLADELEVQGNTVVSQPDGALRIAQMLGNRDGIAPATPGKAKPVSVAAKSSNSTPTKPQPVPQRAVGSPKPASAAPASGAARTAPPGPPAALPQIRSQVDYDRQVRELTNA